MYANNFLKKTSPDFATFSKLDQNFIIKLPHSKMASRNKTKRDSSMTNTFLLGSSRNFTINTFKQLNNITLDTVTSRNLENQNIFGQSKKLLSSRNYSLNKLRKYRFRKETLGNENDELQNQKQSSSSYCKVKILSSQKQNSDQANQLKIKASSTTQFCEHLKNHLKNQSIVGFRVQTHNLLLQLYLTLDYCNLSFLNGTSLQVSTIQQLNCAKIDISCFQIYNCIGVGGFSKVFLCRFKEDGKFYALKLIDKKVILKHNKSRIVMNERNIMESLNHPFVIKMKFAFQTADNLALVLEYCPGGEIFSIIKKYKRMTEEMARFYMIEILLGLEYLHSQGIIYRDFKPENILVDIQGHVKIADFGLAKPNYYSSDDRAYSFCGSPQYMPPEMILKQGHSLAVDFYCIGAVLYEFVTGLPPFYSTDTHQIYEGTLNQSVSFPAKLNLSSQLKSLLRGLLCKQQIHRLGSLQGVKEVLKHPWFGKFFRQKYIKKEMVPPANFRDINSINIEPDELRDQNDTYVMQAHKQQQPRKLNFQLAFNDFYYDYRIQSFGQIKTTTSKWFNKSNYGLKQNNSKTFKESFNLLKKIKSNKQLKRTITTNSNEENFE